MTRSLVPRSLIYSTFQPVDRIEHSTHVRALIFSHEEISLVVANIDGETVQMQRTDGSNLWTAPWKPKSGEEGVVRIDVNTSTGNASSVHHYKTNYNSIKSSSVSPIFTWKYWRVFAYAMIYLVLNNRNIHIICWFLRLFRCCLLARVINTSFLHVFNVKILFKAVQSSGTRGKNTSNNAPLQLSYKSLYIIYTFTWV